MSIEELAGEQARPHLTDTHICPCTHVVWLQVQSLLISCDSLPTLTGVGQCGPKLVPQGIILGPHLEGCSECSNRPIVVPGQVVQHPKRGL